MEIASIDADGWQTVCSDVPAGPLILSDVMVSREGFGTGGEASRFPETLKLTKRIRLPYPNQAVLTADKVALSDFVYATDSVAGVVNHSAVTSPKPIAKWVSLDRSVVGNSVAPELVAFHRDGIACVEFRATDGVTTVRAIASSPVVLGAATDRNAVIGYRAALDLTTLGEGLITVQARVFPRLGREASICDSVEGVSRREFSARYYRKSASLLASPPFVYVANGGNDATGVVSPDPQAAAATPCATVGGALTRINALHGPLDGAIIRLMAGTHVLNSPAASRTQNVAAATITRDPGAARDEVIVQAGTASFNARLTVGLDPAVAVGCLRIQDVSFVRTGTAWVFSLGRNEIQMSGCSVDFALVNVAFGNQTSFFWSGCDLRNISGSTAQSGSTVSHYLWRGCSGDMRSVTFEGYVVLGCSFTSTGRVTNGSVYSGNGQIIAFNRFRVSSTVGGNFAIASNDTHSTGYAFVQNLVEGLPNTPYPMLQPSADGSSMNTDHTLILLNTITGFDAAGRSNQFYNESTGLNRSHVRHRVVGNIHAQLNTKHDIFQLDGSRTGGWSYLYGVGCEGEFSMFRDAGSFAQEYAGAGAHIGTSNTVRNDPMFVDYRAATAAGTGAGGGDYRLRPESPAIGRTLREYLPCDLDGRPRGRRVSGALEADAPPAILLRADGGRHLLRSDGSLSQQIGVRPLGALHPLRDDGAALTPVKAPWDGADGRVLRVEGDTRTLRAGRD